MTFAAIPSPATAVWHLGPFPIRAYALCIIAGIVVACVVTEFRLRRRGAPRWAVLDVAVWAVPFGIVGARIYHVITSPQDYFGAHGEWSRVFQVWEGGLGIWGAVLGGALGAWLGCRRTGLPFAMFADGLAPGLPLAQAVGRFGNWFNNELFGRPTEVPWGLEVHLMDRQRPGQSIKGLDGQPELLEGLYHPTFAYEALWNVGVAGLVLLADRRWKLGRGRAFALYAMGYTIGRFWIEMMRIDDANKIFGQRVNVWVSVVVFLGALLYFLRARGPREYLVPAEAGLDLAGPAAPGELSSVPAAPFLVVTRAQFREYERTGVLSSPAGGRPDLAMDDDGADLVDVSMPPLDDFADDVTDDEEDAPEDDETARGETAGGETAGGDGARSVR